MLKIFLLPLCLAHKKLSVLALDLGGKNWPI